MARSGRCLRGRGASGGWCARRARGGSRTCFRDRRPPWWVIEVGEAREVKRRNATFFWLVGEVEEGREAAGHVPLVSAWWYLNIRNNSAARLGTPNFISSSPRKVKSKSSQSQDMAAPHIPNLNSLRGPDRGRGLGRGRARGGGLRDPFAAATSSNSDTAIQRTDTDASGSRLSVVAAGYLKDEFARMFYPGSDTPRRMPIINRGSQPCRFGIGR